MAFKGGFLLKPTETGVGALANLYMQGKQAIANKKEAIEKEIAEKNTSLSDLVNFKVTGVQDFDSAMIGYGQSTRNTAQQLKSAFDNKEIGLPELNAGLARLTADAKLVSQYPTIISEQIKTIKEGIDKGELSGINLELPGFFKDNNSSQNTILRNYKIENVGGMPMWSHTYQTEDGASTQNVPLSAIIDPNRTKYRKVDTDADVKKFVDILGERKVVGRYDEVQDINGTKVYGRISDPTKQKDIQKYVEDRLDSYGSRDLVSIAFEELGFRGTDFSDYDPKYLSKKADRRKGDFVDSNGNTIEFSGQDFVIKSNERGDFFLDEKQEELVRAHLRRKHYSAIDVEYDEKFLAPPAEPKTTAKEEIAVIPLQNAGIDRQGYFDFAEQLQVMHNKFGSNKATQVSTEGTQLTDTELQKFLTNNNVDVAGMVLPPEVSQIMKKAGISSSSFVNKPIDQITNIAGFRSGNEFKVVVMGPSTVGEFEAEVAGDEIAGKSTSENRFDQSMSSFLDESQVKRIFGYLFRTNDDFKTRAKQRGYSEIPDDASEAMFTILESYNLATKPIQ
jgi:hypothetical protein